MAPFVHARLFETETYGQVLVFLDLDEDGDMTTTLRVWVPDTGPCDLTLRLSAGGSDKARDVWEEAQCEALTEMTEERALSALRTAGVGEILESLRE